MFFLRQIHDLENRFLRKTISLEKFHQEAAQFYHCFTKKLVHREGDFLHDDVDEEIDITMEEHEPVMEEEDESFLPDDEWRPQVEAMSESFEESEPEADLDTQADAAQLALLKEAPECPICLGAVTDPHLSQCGHEACLVCWTRQGVTIEGNLPPYEPCPQCRTGVRFLVKLYRPRYRPLGVLLDNAAERQEYIRDLTAREAEYDLNPNLTQGPFYI